MVLVTVIMARYFTKKQKALHYCNAFCFLCYTHSVGRRTNLAFLDALGDDFLGDGLRNRLILLEDHREGTATLSDRTDGVRITEHFPERNRRLDELDAGAIFHAFNAAATLVDRTVGSTHVLIRNGDFNIHHRLEKLRLRLEKRLLEALASALDEREFVRVDFVVRTEVHRRLDVDHGEATQRTLLESLLDALFDRWDVFRRNDTALDLVDEFEFLARLLRLDTRGRTDRDHRTA